MTQIDAVIAFCALYRAVMDCEGHCIALPERHHFGPALHPRALFRQHEFATGKIAPRFGQKERNLDREGQIAIEILMQAVEVARHILPSFHQQPQPALVKETSRPASETESPL